MLKRILMMSDLGPVSVRAFPPLIALAKSVDDAEVILVHTVEGSSEQTFLDSFICEMIDQRARAAAQGPLQAQAEQLREAGIAHVETEVVIGSPFSVVHEVHRRHDADLIIMPTLGHHSLLRRVSNSATARVIRDNNVPVMVINGAFDEAHWQAFGPVVYPVELGPQMAAGIRTATDFAKLVNTGLHLIHVLRPVPPPSAYDSDPALRKAVVEGHIAWRAKVGSRLRELAAKNSDVKTLGMVLEHDNAGQGIVAYLKKIQAGSVVLPSLGHDAVHTQLMGSVAEHVLLHAPCPALIFDKPLID